MRQHPQPGTATCPPTNRDTRSGRSRRPTTLGRPGLNGPATWGRRLALSLLAFTLPAAAVDDPLDSSRWADMERQFFPEQTVRFDGLVTVNAPLTAEDPLNVPVAITIDSATPVEEVLVIADFNPIVKVLRYEPALASANLSFRLKLQQSSPIRAAARTADGVWHVGGTWVNTTGGGCTLPSLGNGSPLWEARLNEVNARRWDRSNGPSRVRFEIIHPMDTGLAAGIPTFYIDELTLRNAAGEALVHIYPAEPVSENPLFTVDMPQQLLGDGVMHIAGRDNNGNPIRAEVAR